MKSSLTIAPVLKKLSYGDHERPSRDWFALLSVATFLVCVSIAWNVWLLRSVEEGGTFGEGAGSTESFDETPIESVRAVFQSRVGEQQRFRQEYRFVDPSR